ncbi:submaxillary gland androgen-regulated protein 3A-like [Aquila chrysaetos chrysaetos]|uniref:submaxillary gland androgen-regulated protein 3A-like n=1 Tax=Aquila chrysaetos chrysaetos TaxID=223781 RepID=UPI00117726FF|nr:submaxillary gland androgen-regulated protein 3A-like [Aquila chrysaetos chrysaetos]
MTQAGGRGSAPPGAPCLHPPPPPSAQRQRGDGTGFVAPEEVRTLPEVSLLSFSTPPSHATARARPSLLPSHLPARDRHGKSPENGPGGTSPRTDPLPVPATAPLCAGGCRDSPAPPARRQKKPVSLLSSCVFSLS